MSDNINPTGLNVSPLIDRPEKVAIVAMGMSSPSFVGDMMMSKLGKNPFDEVWTLNRGLKGFIHDKVFCMDDLKWLEKKRPDYSDWLKNHDKPIITSTAYPDFPMSVPYPLHQVGEFLQDDIFVVNTVSYMVAYAMYIGVQDMVIYGADFCYPNGNMAEKGGQAVTYLLGRCKERGIRFRLPPTSTLLYANEVSVQEDGIGKRVFYGYHRKKELDDEEKKVETFKQIREQAKAWDTREPVEEK